MGKQRPKYCGYPEDFKIANQILHGRCGEDATHLVYCPTEMWLCDEHYAEYMRYRSPVSDEELT